MQMKSSLHEASMTRYAQNNTATAKTMMDSREETQNKNIYIYSKSNPTDF